MDIGFHSLRECHYYVSVISLIRYAAKYHRGLGWCVYDVKFRQKTAANKSILWSVSRQPIMAENVYCLPFTYERRYCIFPIRTLIRAKYI